MSALGVPEGCEKEHAGVPGRAREMTQQEQRRAIRPVHVLDRQQHRLATRDVRQQVGYRRVETMAFGVRIPGDRVRKLADPLRKVGKKPRELTAPCSEIGAKDIGLGDARELLECGHERSVRRADDGVAGAVENENAVSGRVVRQLSNEPALSGAGLAGEQSDPPAVAPGVRQERSERGELPRAPDERKRRRQAERTRKSQRARPRS